LIDLRIKFMECYVWSVLLYGGEGWTLKISSVKKLEALKMWLYHRTLKITWSARAPPVDRAGLRVREE